MGMSVSETGGGDFRILDAGTHPAVATWIVGIGPQLTNFGEKEQIKIRFEVPGERVEWQDRDGNQGEGPMVIWATYTASLNEKAKLRKHLEHWRNKAFTETELMGFDMDNILGKPCLITVVHNTAANGRTYANIDSISGLVKGMTAPVHEGDLLSFNPYDYTEEQFNMLPEWLQDKVTEGLALLEQQKARTRAEPPAPQPAEDFAEEDIPF